jgi:hypothetical protein
LRRARHWATVALIVAGFLQPVGYLTGLPALRGLGIAWVLSPLPLVFSHFRGVETFTSSFEVTLITTSGKDVTVALTPENYNRLRGPYSRRNVYGAITAYGPALTEGNEPALVQDILHYGFCKGPLPSALGVDEPLRSAKIHVSNKRGERPVDATMEVQCMP